jgi:hypothetical protein
MTGADCGGKIIIDWLVICVNLVGEKNTVSWWLISETKVFPEVAARIHC